MHNIRFLLGDYAEKRKYLRESGSYAYADNDEVDGVIRIDGKDYFFLSSHPFGDFTALQYLSYCRALINFAPLSEREMKDMCSLLGVRLAPNRKLKKFPILKRRLISLIATYKPGGELRINLDGYCYTRRRKKALTRMIKKLARYAPVTVAVSDSRFIIKKTHAEYIKCGYVYAAVSRLRTRAVSRRRVRRLLKASKSGMPVPIAKEIICCAPVAI